MPPPHHPSVSRPNQLQVPSQPTPGPVPTNSRSAPMPGHLGVLTLMSEGWHELEAAMSSSVEMSLALRLATEIAFAAVEAPDHAQLL